MCYPFCEMVHIIEPLLLIGKNGPPAIDRTTSHAHGHVQNVIVCGQVNTISQS